MSLHPVLAVIPARGGSKGLPGKNVRPLAGLPLIAHSIRCAKLTSAIARVVVSTDDPAIAEVARAHGAETPFMRPAELASDAAAMWPVIRHALEATESKSSAHYGSVILLDPTSPGRIPSDIAQAVERLEKSPAADGVIGVSEPEFNPFWHCVVEDDDGFMQDLIPGADQYTRRQDVPTVYRINATLYVWRREHVLNASDWRKGRHLLQIIPENRALHIDDLEQFEHARVLLEAGLLKFPWLP